MDVNTYNPGWGRPSKCSFKGRIIKAKGYYNIPYNKNHFLMAENTTVKTQEMIWKNCDIYDQLL